MKKGDPAITICFLSAFEMYAHEFERVSFYEWRWNYHQKAHTKQYTAKGNNSLFEDVRNRQSSSWRAYILVVFETHKELVDQALECLKIGLLEKEEDVMIVTDAIPVDR